MCGSYSCVYRRSLQSLAIYVDTLDRQHARFSNEIIFFFEYLSFVCRTKVLWRVWAEFVSSFLPEQII